MVHSSSFRAGNNLIRRQRTLTVDPTPLPPGSEYSSSPCFLRTMKGALKLCDGAGFRFIRNRVDGTKTYWNCEKKKNECKARAISLADQPDVVFNDMAHNHLPPHRVPGSTEYMSLVNPVLSPKDTGKEDRPLTSNEMEKVLELQNSVMLRRRLPNTFGYPDFGYRPGLSLFQENQESIQNAEKVYEQQKLLQNLLKHYQTSLLEESSPWLGATSLLYSKSQQHEDEDDLRLKEERKRFKREEEGKVFAKQRKTNFTSKEVETLLNCVADKKEVILFGVAGGKGWAKAWQDIAKVVTNAEGIERTEGDVRKKWTYLKWEAKNTSKPGRDPVSKHVLNILTSRDREVALAMNLRSAAEGLPKIVQPPVGPPTPSQLLSPATSPLPALSKQTSPSPPTKKPVPAVQSLQKMPGMKEIKPQPSAKQVAKVQQPQQPPAEVCLRWNSYHSNMQNTFPSLLNNEQFVDVTLACDGRSIKCHKVMLSACSPYMEELLSANPCQHPIIFLKDMKFWQLAALVDFMYRGEVNVTQDKLPSLLAAAEALQIKGLASPVHPSGSPRTIHDTDTSDNVSLLQQFKSEIRTDADDDYNQDTDDSMPPQAPRPKKRKVSDGSSVSSGGYHMNGKKPRDKERLRDPSSQSVNSSLPVATHYNTPSTKTRPQNSVQRTSSIQESDYQDYGSQGNQPVDDLNIDEEQAQMILERYTQQDDAYSRDEEDYSNGSG